MLMHQVTARIQARTTILVVLLALLPMIPMA